MGKYPAPLKELKFYIPTSSLIKQGYTPEQCHTYVDNMPDIRKQVLNLLTRYADGVFAAILDKRMAKRTWTSERLGNYVFAQTLIVNIMRQIKLDRPLAIIYDKGRLSPSREASFDSYLLRTQDHFNNPHFKSYSGFVDSLRSVSSLFFPGIWAADCVAGEFYHKYMASDDYYSNILKPIMIDGGERKFW